MTRVWLLVLLLFSSAIAMPQNQLVLPARHAMMRIFRGDINNDGQSDLIVLARSWDEAANPDTPRPMLIFLRNTQGHLQRVARANTVIRCAACSGAVGDAWARKDKNLARIILEPNGFSVLEFVGSGWRGWSKVSFRFINGWFRLSKCEQKTFHVGHIFAPVITIVTSKPVLLEAFKQSDC
ncbi:MAG: hypothetical protein RLZZ156_1810 [Deinococcota bacterium]|jgi:hypothetical protein